MVITGLERLMNESPDILREKGVGILCHAASVDSGYTHIIDWARCTGVSLKAVFGPQHGLYGQTQDNMIEWQGDENLREETEGHIPLYSLYGDQRRPTKKMLEDIDVFIVDLQDVGARPYTYMWTMKECMCALADTNASMWVLDRPNPIAFCGADGPVLDSSLYTFVGGARIPLAHTMTMGEAARWIQQDLNLDIDLRVITMEGWKRSMTFPETGLPWVLPSPNMPDFSTGMVYPGMVLFETVNVSEGRGTTRPFEFFGAPWLSCSDVKNHGRAFFEKSEIILRRHDFIPTFNKYTGEYCRGFQIHPRGRNFKSVLTAAVILQGIYNSSPTRFSFLPPPYEYEYDKLPFDIVAGDRNLKDWIASDGSPEELQHHWQNQYTEFYNAFERVKLY